MRTDDLLKGSLHMAPWRPAAGIAPQISDADLVTLAVMQGRAGLHLAVPLAAQCPQPPAGHVRYLPGQPGYNNRLRALAGSMAWLITVLARDMSLWSDDVRVADSTPVECGRSRETTRR